MLQLSSAKKLAEYIKTLTMNIKNTFLLILVLNITSSIAQDKTLTSPKEAREFSQKCSNLFKDNKISQFFGELRPYWPLPENEINGLEEKTIQYINLLQSRFGKIEGVVKVKEEVINDFAIRETFILKFENSAIRLIYTYYKNNSGWVLNAFKWDDSFSEEFK